MYLDKVSTCIIGDRLILALDKRWIEVNNGKSLEFEAKINEKNELVLSSPLAAKQDKTMFAISEMSDNDA